MKKKFAEIMIGAEVESVSNDERNIIPYADCIGNILNELIDIVEETTRTSDSQPEELFSPNLKHFATAMKELTCLTTKETSLSSKDLRNRELHLDRAKSQIGRLTEIGQQLESDFEKEKTESNLKIFEKKSEVERLQVILKQVLDITNFHTQNMRNDKEKSMKQLEAASLESQQNLLQEVECLEKTLESIQNDNAKEEQEMRQKRCFTQSSLDEITMKREKEILYKQNFLNGVDYEYRRQERVLHQLEDQIHQVEEELGQIKELQKQATEKHQERQRKLKDVFRTWIRVRFAFQKN